MHHWLLVISVVSLGIAVLVFGRNVEHRRIIGNTLSSASLKLPERMTERYDAGYLKQVAIVLDARRVGGGTALDLYRRPVLLWNDVVFAIALALFSASLWIWVLIQFKPWLESWPVVRYLIIFAAASAVLYGVFDTAEDIMLERLLGQHQAITHGEATNASRLTQIKIVTNGGSVTGTLVFLALSVLTKDKPAAAE
jgi:hypothetical protein